MVILHLRQNEYATEIALFLIKNNAGNFWTHF